MNRPRINDVVLAACSLYMQNNPAACPQEFNRHLKCCQNKYRFRETTLHNIPKYLDMIIAEPLIVCFFHRFDSVEQRT